MKKQSDLSRLMGYAGNYRYFTYASWVLSAVSALVALVALVPFVYPAGCAERRAELHAGGKHPPLRLDGSVVCDAVLPYLHCSADVLPPVGVSGGDQSAAGGVRAEIRTVPGGHVGFIVQAERYLDLMETFLQRNGI